MNASIIVHVWIPHSLHFYANWNGQKQINSGGDLWTGMGRKTPVAKEEHNLLEKNNIIYWESYIGTLGFPTGCVLF